MYIIFHIGTYAVEPWVCYLTPSLVRRAPPYISARCWSTESLLDVRPGTFTNLDPDPISQPIFVWRIRGTQESIESGEYVSVDPREYRCLTGQSCQVSDGFLRPLSSLERAILHRPVTSTSINSPFARLSIAAFTLDLG